MQKLPIDHLQSRRLPFNLLFIHGFRCDTYANRGFVRSRAGRRIGLPARKKKGRWLPTDLVPFPFRDSADRGDRAAPNHLD